MSESWSRSLLVVLFLTGFASGQDLGKPPKAPRSARQAAPVPQTAPGLEPIPPAARFSHSPLQKTETFADGQTLEVIRPSRSEAIGKLGELKKFEAAVAAQEDRKPYDEWIAEQAKQFGLVAATQLFQDVDDIFQYVLTDAHGRVTRFVELREGDEGYLAELDLPDGLTYRRVGPPHWHRWRVREEATGEEYDFYGEIEHLGGGTIRLTDAANHQIDTRRGDGSRTLVLLTEVIRMNDRGQLVPVEIPEFTIRWSGRKNLVHLWGDSWTADAESITVTDRVGRRYLLDAEHEQFRLSRDTATGNLSFTNHRDVSITIKPDGARESWSEDGGTTYDRGGRRKREYKSRGGPAVNGYYYIHLTNGTCELYRFFTKNGDWEKTDQRQGKFDEWELQNGDMSNPTGKKLRVLWPRVTATRRNSIIFADDLDPVPQEQGAAKRSKKRRPQTTFCEGGALVENARYVLDEAGERQPLLLPRGEWPKGQPTVTEISVADGSGPRAYWLTTYRDAEGKIFKQEFGRADGSKLVRGGEGRDFQSYMWESFDKDGKVVKRDSLFLELAIDEDGTIIRRKFLTEPDPRRPGGRRVRLTAERPRKPVVEATTYIYTSGESETMFPHGGAIYRDRDGHVLWARYPNAEEIHILYARNEAGGKTVAAVQFGNESWHYNPDTQSFFGERGASGFRLAERYADVLVTHATAELALIDVWNEHRTVLSMDGTTHVERNDGSRWTTDAQGRLIGYVSPTSDEVRAEYADDGKLVRMDEQSAGLAVVDEDYEAPPDRPLPKTTLRATELQAHGSGDHFHVTYLLPDLKRQVREWPVVSSSEWRDTEGTVVRVLLGRLKIVLQSVLRPSEKADEFVEVAKKIDPVRGSGWEQFVDCTTLDGDRVRWHFNSLRLRFDQSGRILEATTYSKKVYHFTYVGDQGKRLASVSGPGLELHRNAQTGRAVWRKNDRDVPLADFGLTDAGQKIVIDFEGGDQLREVIDLREWKRGQRTVVRRDGVVAWYDTQGRNISEFDLTGKGSFLSMDGTTHVERNDGSRWTTDAQGRLIRYVSPTSDEVRAEYADDGKLVRMDEESAGYAVVDEDYDAPPDRPLPKTTLRATELQAHGSGDHFHVTYVLPDLKRQVREWPVVSSSEWRDTEGAVVQVLLGRLKIILQSELRPSEKADEGVEVAKKIDRLRGSGREQFVEYTTIDGDRVRWHFNRLRLRLDESGRIIKSTTRSKKVYQFTYVDEQGKRLASATGPGLDLHRTAQTGRAVWRKNDGDVPLADFGLTDAGEKIVINFEGGDQLREVIDLREWKRGERAVVRRDGGVVWYDDRGRKISEFDLSGNGSFWTYESDSKPPESSSFDGGIPKTGTQTKTELHFDGQELSGFTKTASERSGKDVKFTVMKRDGQWIDGAGNKYDTLVYDKPSKRLILSSASGYRWRVIGTEAGEVEVHFDETYRLRSRVSRNALGEVVTIEDSQEKRTNILRRENGEIEGIQQGYGLITGTNATGQFGCSDLPGAIFIAKVEVDRQGNQIWSGDNGVRRTVWADGRVEIVHPTKSRTVYAADGTLVRHYPADGSELREAEVSKSGKVVLTFQDGSIWRHPAYSREILKFAQDENNERQRQNATAIVAGTIEVNRRGDVTIQEREGSARTITVHLASGKKRTFADYSQKGDRFVVSAAWHDVETGEPFAMVDDSLERLAAQGWARWLGEYRQDADAGVLNLLAEQGLALPGRADNAFDMHDATVDSKLIRGMEYLQPRRMRPVVDDKGNRRWTFTAPIEREGEYSGREGLPAGHPIDEVVQRQDGRVTIAFVGGETLQLEAGSCRVTDDGLVTLLPEVPDSVPVGLLHRAAAWSKVDAFAPRSIDILQKAIEQYHAAKEPREPADAGAVKDASAASIEQEAQKLMGAGRPYEALLTLTRGIEAHERRLAAAEGDEEKRQAAKGLYSLLMTIYAHHTFEKDYAVLREALAAVDRMIEIGVLLGNDSVLSAHGFRGNVLMMMGEEERADAAYKKSIELGNAPHIVAFERELYGKKQPRDQEKAATLRYGKTAELRRQQKDLAGAERDLLLGLKYAPKSQALREQLDRLRAETDVAAAASGQGTPLDAPTMANAYQALADAYRRQGQREQALGVGEKSLEWIRRLVGDGNAQTQYLAGQLHLAAAQDAGENQQQRQSQALDYYRRSAEQGYSPAQLALADVYEHGRAGIKPDIDTAVMWFRKAIRLDDQPDPLDLGLLGNPLRVSALNWHVSVEGWFRRYQGTLLGRLAFSNVRQAAEDGDVFAQRFLGKAYDQGVGTEVDKEQARQWKLKAAQQGHVGAQLELAEWFVDQEDYPNAAIWFEKAALQGNKAAQARLKELGDLLPKRPDSTAGTPGTKPPPPGVTSTPPRVTFDVLLKAAEAGDARAQKQVGLEYMRKQQWAQAKVWLEKAAGQGDPAAKAVLPVVEKQLERERK